MAYQRQTQRLLAGGMSLITPADQTPEPFSPRLDNWRQDISGALRSRAGMSQVSSSAGFVAHTLYRHGNDRYAVSGGNLYYGPALNVILGGIAFDGEPVGFAAYQEFVWAMNRAQQVRLLGNIVAPWRLDAPTTAPLSGLAGAGPLTGDLVYYLTFVTDNGQETNGSPGSVTLTAAGNAVQLSWAEVPSTDFAYVRIYREGGALRTPTRIAQVDRLVSSYLDTVDDDTALDNGDEMPEDHDPPPAGRGVVGPYFGKLVVWGVEAHLARYYWTLTAQPHFFPGSADEAEGNWEDAGDDGDPLLQVTNHRRMLIFYKRKSIWRVVGDLDTSDPELVDPDGGLFGRYAVANAGAVDYYRRTDGIYECNGDGSRKVSGVLDPIFKSQYVQISQDLYALPVEPAYRDLECMAAFGGQLYWSYTEVGQTAPNVTLVMDLATGRWSRMTSALGGFRALFNESDQSGLVGAPTAGGVYQLESGEQDAGNAIPLVWQSPLYDQERPDSEKRYAELAIDYQTALFAGQTPSTLAVSVLYENGTAAALGSLTSSERTMFRKQLGTSGQGQKARNFGIRITGSVRSTVILYGVYLYYYFEARKARSFDSGVMDLGTELVKTLDRIELEIEADGLVNWAVHSDIPGNAMASRATGALSTLGRQTVTLILQDLLGARVDGRYLRVLFWSDQDFQLHNLRLRVQPVGLYIDAATPWESEGLLIA